MEACTLPQHTQQSGRATARPGCVKDDGSIIPFRRPTQSDASKIQEILSRYRPSQACDFTLGGIYMWVDYFDYKVAIINDTVFLKGHSEDGTHRQAFSLPFGAMPLQQSVDRLRAHCRATGEKLFFSAVPADCLPQLEGVGEFKVEKLQGWSDYVYDIESLATLTGKKFNKKRNHVNRFISDNPGYVFEPLTPGNAREALAFYAPLATGDDENPMAEYDREQVMWVLETFGNQPAWEGAVLSVPGLGVVAFTIGEVAGDTLVIHIEKMDHNIPGAGESINKMFASLMKARHPGLKWVNREEDLGDPGLRRAKLSYRPAFLIDKYNAEAI